jgi:hypothetical protein
MIADCGLRIADWGSTAVEHETPHVGPQGPAHPMKEKAEDEDENEDEDDPDVHRESPVA